MSAVNVQTDTVSVRTTCPYCGVGCGIIANRDKEGTVSIQGDPEHPSNYGRLCSKGSALGETLSLDDRLLHPEINGQRVEWDEALATVADRIRNSIDEHGPDSVAFYVSGQLLTEDYYVANKLMKGFIGSANIDTNSRLCMSSAVAGYKRAFGADFVPCSYTDLETTDLLVIVGSNTAWCHPVIYQRMVKAKNDNPDLQVVVIDPRKTATCDFADIHLPIRPGTDVALFNGLLNYLRQEDCLDREFLEKHCEGFAATINAAKQDMPSIPRVAEVCNLQEKDVAAFFRLFARTQKTVTLFSQGVNQSSRGTDKVNAIINCHLATGRIGKTGMGPFSITGQPNAMGGREVGGLANQLAAHMDIDNPEHRETVRTFWNTDTVADRPGLTAVDLFRAVQSGQIKVLWIMATNPVDSIPDADAIIAALDKCETVIVSDCIRHTDTTRYADILLPAQAWGEKDGTVTNSERRISRQRAFLESPGQARPDWWIVTQVAWRLGYRQHFYYASPADIFREHAGLSGYRNDGERDFDISALDSINADAYENLSPVQWPVPGKQAAGNSIPLSDGKFFHADGKARMVAVCYFPPVHAVDREFPLVLNTGRVRDHWHTLTRTGKSPRLSQHVSEPCCEIHPADAVRMQIANGALLRIRSQWGNMVARARYSDDQLPGSVFVPIHWTAQFASSARVDAVVNPVTDAISGQPEAKHTPVTIEPVKMEWEGFLVICRSLENIPVRYWVKSRGYGHWLYKLADDTIPEDWQAWAGKLVHCEPSRSDWLEYSDSAAVSYRAAEIRQGKLESCLFVAGNASQLPDPDWLQGLFNGAPLDRKQRASLLAGKPADSLQDNGPVVCSCFSVGKNLLSQTIRERKLSRVEDIGRCLQAGTNCGSCIPELREILQDTITTCDPA